MHFVFSHFLIQVKAAQAMAINEPESTCFRQLDRCSSTLAQLKMKQTCILHKPLDTWQEKSNNEKYTLLTNKLAIKQAIKKKTQSNHLCFFLWKILQSCTEDKKKERNEHGHGWFGRRTANGNSLYDQAINYKGLLTLTGCVELVRHCMMHLQGFISGLWWFKIVGERVFSVLLTLPFNNHHDPVSTFDQKYAVFDVFFPTNTWPKCQYIPIKYN